MSVSVTIVAADGSALHTLASETVTISVNERLVAQARQIALTRQVALSRQVATTRQY